MSEFDGLIKQIKQAALDAVNSAGPAGFYEGTVLSVSPLKVKVDQKLILGKEQLVLARNVTNHEMSVDVDWEYEKGTKKIVIHNALEKQKPKTPRMMLISKKLISDVDTIVFILPYSLAPK